MNKITPKPCRALALLLAAGVLAASLTGCDSSTLASLQKLAAGAFPAVQPGQTVSEDSKWVNSSLVGALEEDTPTDLKDDFYTAVNRDWLLDAALDPLHGNTTAFGANENALAARQASLLRGTPDPDADENGTLPGLSAAQTAHDQELVRQFAALAEDTAARQDAGAEPARPYLEAVAGIGTMEELTAYLLNTDGKNIAGTTLVPVAVAVPYSERTAYVVAVEDTPALTLGGAANYRALDIDAAKAKNKTFVQVRYLLARLGWGEGEITALLQNALRFEQKLAHSLLDESGYEKTTLYEMKDNSLTGAELAELQGDYPLGAILAQRGMAGAERYVVAQPDYLRAVGQLYNAANLAEIKAYCLVHTVPALLPLLDEESRQMGLYAGEAPATAETADDAEQTDTQRAADAALIAMVDEYLPEPFQQLYAARYCTPAQKAALQAMVEEIIEVYHTLLQGEDWLSEETRAAAIQKLDAMTVRCLYPDTFTDYTALDLSGAATLPDAVAAIRHFGQSKDAELINQPVTTAHWDLHALPTTLANACYIPEENSINLLAGMMATDFFYAPDAPEELLLARIGTIIAHEISHGFDDSGAKYDGAGYLVNWWQVSDLTTFMQRTNRLVKFYNAQSIAPGVMLSTYGNSVKGEAVADMAGVKAALLVAADKPDFDYEAFFSDYASMWRMKYPFAMLLPLASDVHPLGFLRANVTLQQFDEFMKIYDLKPGDGMYLAPEDRVTVW